jgi:hypothetical protein
VRDKKKGKRDGLILSQLSMMLGNILQQYQYHQPFFG